MTDQTISKEQPAQPTREQRLYDALKRITKYDSVQGIHRTAEKRYGLSGEEVIEMAYENVVNEARIAIRGMRRPK